MVNRFWNRIIAFGYIIASIRKKLYKLINCFCKKLNTETLIVEARVRTEEMQTMILKKKIQDYYETINSGKTEIASFILAEREIERLKRSGEFNKLVSRALQDEVR